MVMAHMLFEWGIIHISTESIVRGLHLSLRTITVSMFGVLIALTSQIVMIFYSLMQHLKVKPKIVCIYGRYSYGTTYFHIIYPIKTFFKNALPND